jgi:hypothetical protein
LRGATGSFFFAVVVARPRLFVMTIVDDREPPH